MRRNFGGWCAWMRGAATTSPTCASCAPPVKRTKATSGRARGDPPLAPSPIGPLKPRPCAFSIRVAAAATFLWKRSSSSYGFEWPKSGFSVEEAIRLVLRDNLFGLEIDPRCTQIAAFNLALAAWRLAGEPIDLPPLNIACTGLAPNATEAEWRELAEAAEGSTGLAEDRDLFGGEASLARGPLQEGMAALHRLFRRAPELGSLLDPGSLGSDLFRADFKSLAKLLDLAIRRERGSAGRDERAVAAAGMARAAEILQGRYTLVVTNVPFLARGKQGGGLRSFAETPWSMPRETSPRCSCRASSVGLARGEHRRWCRRRTGCS